MTSHRPDHHAVKSFSKFTTPAPAVIQLAVLTGGNLRWAYLDPYTADQSKNCSALDHGNNSYIGNVAKLAGGVLFSSDIHSSRLNCKLLSMCDAYHNKL